MRLLAVTLALLALAACSSSSTPAAQTTTAPAAAGPDEALAAQVRALSADQAAHVLAITPGPTVQVATDLERVAANGPLGLALCLNTQAAVGGTPEVQVTAADGGVLASTRAGLCAVRV